MSGVSIATGVIATDALGGGVGRGLQSPGVLVQSGAASSVTGSTSLTTLATIIIPGGSVGPNGRIRLTVFYNNPVGRTNSWTPSATFAGLTLYSTTLTSAIGSFTFTTDIWAANSITNQVAPPFGELGSNGTAQRVYTANMANDQIILLQGQLVAGADTMTLAAYTVEILNP